MQSPTIPRARQWSADEEASTLRTLNTFAVDLIAIPSVEDLFWYVAQNVVGRLNFVDCVIYQADEDQTQSATGCSLGAEKPLWAQHCRSLGDPFWQAGSQARLRRRGQPIIIDDLLKDQNYIPDTQPARSEICVPLVFRGRVVGVIDSEHPDPAPLARPSWKF